VELDDPRGKVLQALARAGGTDPRPLLAHEPTFGSLGACPDYVEEVRRDVWELEYDDPRAVIERRTMVGSGVAS